MTPDVDHKFIEEHLPMIKFIAFKIAKGLPASIEMDDLIQWGALGLLDAAQKFDPTREIKFRSYAEFRIRGAILDGLRKEDPTARSVRDLEKTLSAASREIQIERGRAAATHEIADKLGVSLAEVNEIRARALPVDIVSVDDYANRFLASDRKALLATVKNKGQDLEEKLMAIQKLERIVYGHNQIDRVCFMLLNIWGLTLKEIAELFQVSESRISQRIKKVQKGVRDYGEDQISP